MSMDNIQQVLLDAHREASNNLTGGKVADYIPELAKASATSLGACIMMPDGTTYLAGDAEIPFTIQSIANTLTLILALKTAGFDRVFSKVGIEPTGDRFDSILQLELKDWRPFNPMINAGAIVTIDCIRGGDIFERYLELVRTVCGKKTIHLNEAVYHSEKKTGIRNRSIAYLLKSAEYLDGEPEEILDIYFRTCSVMVTAKDLAHYAMVLSSGGKDPLTGKQLIEPHIVPLVKTLMMLCGMYDESGEYAVKVGMPSKSGVGGGIVAVGPNGMGLGTFGPMLNTKGNSIGGEQILQHLSEKLHLHKFAP